MDSKINKEKSFESLEVAQKSKAAATLTKENAQAQLTAILAQRTECAQLAVDGDTDTHDMCCGIFPCSKSDQMP